MKEILSKLIEGITLSKEEAKQILTNIAQGNYSDPEIASFLTVFMMRGVTVDELSGYQSAMSDLCIRVNLDGFDTIDVCGTGGDGKDTFNISTLTAFVLAGAGAKVAKHGNYGVSSGCGSSNIMEHLGCKFTNNEDKLKKQMDHSGLCFLHAPMFHPAMKNVAPVRKALKLKTFFNMLGPLVNPSFPKKQMIGVFNMEILRLYSYLLQDTEKQYLIVHSLDGYDEVSLTSDFYAVGKKISRTYSPVDLNFVRVKPHDIIGGKSIPEAADIFMKILKGEGTKEQNIVVTANAAMALSCYFPELTLSQCIEKAEGSLLGRKAHDSLKALIENK